MKYLKTLSLVLSIVFFSYVKADTYVVVDLDETVRQSNVLNKADALFRIISNRVSTYEGMRHILKSLEEDRIEKGEGIKFFYISASFNWLYDAESWLEKYDFPVGEINQRTLGEKTKEYKIQTILSHLSATVLETDEVIFIGDNAEHDPEVYQTVSKRLDLAFAPKVFIRDIKGEQMIFKKSRREGVFYFLSVFEILKSKIKELKIEKLDHQKFLIKRDRLIPQYTRKRISKKLGKKRSQGFFKHYYQKYLAYINALIVY
ncbi:MAG: phosphatase domain-containing protein [Bacteriovoracaceae bacterium]